MKVVDKNKKYLKRVNNYYLHKKMNGTILNEPSMFVVPEYTSRLHLYNLNLMALKLTKDGPVMFEKKLRQYVPAT